jgi:site-specific DNA-cytosine methylase
MNVLSLFDGIGTARVALERAGIAVNTYYASEIDPSAIKVSMHNYPDIVQLGCVTAVSAQRLPVIDLLVGGSPCQGFSRAGKHQNFEDARSNLVFEFVRLVNELKPRYFLLENARMSPSCQHTISMLLGVHPLVINSALVSAQNRVRLYWTNIKANEPLDRGVTLADVIGEHDGVYRRPRGRDPGGIVHGKCPTITSSSWQSNNMVVQHGVKRKFSTTECELIQTLPAGYTSILGETKRYKVIGSGMTSDVIQHIFSHVNTV